MLQKQLGLSPSGKDISKGCLWFMGIFLIVYVIQIFYVYHRIHTPLQHHDLGSGYELEINDSYWEGNYFPLIGFLNINITGEYEMVVKRDGQEVFWTDILGDDAHTPLTQLKIYNQNGEALLTYTADPKYPQFVRLNIPAPADAPLWPVPAAAPDATATARQQQLVAKIADETEKGSRSLSAINSQLIYRTPAIDRVVAEGPSIVPLLVATMEQADTEFDTFTRCYTACAQIRPEAKIRWSGGAFSAINVDGVTRFRDTSVYLDLEGFKKGVIVEIRAAFNLPMPPGPAPTVQGPQ